jgi:ferredoxin-thioredoxin reductase catalytic subunit
LDRKRVKEETGKIRTVAEKGGYALNPDAAFVESLAEGILVNRDRYGYDSCPCRLATGDRETDRVIVCPCDFRDEDLADFNACFCALYVTEGYLGDANPVVPDRWDPDAEEAFPSKAETQLTGDFTTAAAQVCQVCGYIAFKDKPPRKCPICGVSHERFKAVQLVLIP